MRIIGLEINNFLKIKAVLIKPDKNVIRVEGKNAQGKSSIINAIWTALGGKESVPEHPINNNATDARITVDLGEMIVTRKFTEKGTYLEVTSPDGKAKYTRPQETLDLLFSKISYDPQNFIDMKPAERRECLLNLTGQREKIIAIERKKSEIYASRTLVNRDIANLKGKLSDAPKDEAIEEIKVADLLAELEAAEQEDKDYEEHRISAEDYQREAYDYERYARECSLEIDRLKAEVVRQEENLKAHNQKASETRMEADKEFAIYDCRPESKVLAIKHSIANIEEHNIRVRKIQEANELRRDLADREAEADMLTGEIKKCDEQKLQILSDANLPLEGLTIDGDDIFIDGINFEDRSTSEKIKTALAIGMAQNPKLRALKIKNGGELDSDSMAIIEKWADDNDVQIFIERVCDEPSGLGIFIEDGEIKGEVNAEHNEN